MKRVSGRSDQAAEFCPDVRSLPSQDALRPLSWPGAVMGGTILLLARDQRMAEPMAGELDGYTLLHILGVGGVTAIALGLGYGIVNLIEWIVNGRG